MLIVKRTKMFTRKQITTVLAQALLFLPMNSEKQQGTIYIILWSFVPDQHWSYRNLDLEPGYEAFVKRKCSFQNCYLTTNRTYFNNVLDFDVLLFNAVHLHYKYPIEDLPVNRSPSQLYVLFSVEPAGYTNLVPEVDNIFNLTWTYLLKSDIVNPYFFFKNLADEIIAPKIDVHWVDNNKIQPPSSFILQKIEKKCIAALWVVSNCGPALRLDFARQLRQELSKYGHRLDIYGRCGDQNYCQRIEGEKDAVLSSCYSQIESDYYFYLAFENTLSEDYVTEKVLHGLLHYSVPIVYGGADYARFLPDRTYLNAVKLGVGGLAQEMVSIINSTKRYSDFFKWHSYYTIHDVRVDNYRESVCSFCAYLNDKANRNKTHVYTHIRDWYNAPSPELYLNTPYSDYKTEAENLETTTASFLSKIIDYFLDE